MADDVARAVGAEGPEAITIAGKECIVRPLTLKELSGVERECLQMYKRQHLETYSRNLDLLDEADASNIMIRQLEIVALWDISDLPTKSVYDPIQVKISDGLKLWAVDNLAVVLTDSKGEDMEDKKINDLVRANVATALDSQVLSDELYENLTGEVPKKTKVNYISWWITGSFEGMLTLVWMCFKHCGVTKEEVEDAMGIDPGILAYFARSIEHLSTPAVGNG